MQLLRKLSALLVYIDSMKNLILQNTETLFHRAGRGGMMGPRGMMGEGSEMFMGGMIVAAIIATLVIVLLVLGIVKLTQSIKSSRKTKSTIKEEE